MSQQVQTNYADVAELGVASSRAPLQRTKPRSVELGGIELHALSEADCVGIILDEIEAGRGGVVRTICLDQLRQCRTDVVLAALAMEADLIVAAGMPLVWASRLRGTSLPERVAGADLISSLSAGAMQHGRSIFLLSDQDVQPTANLLRQRYPQLKITGHFCMTGSDAQDQGEQSPLTQMIRTAGPDIVFVGLASPRQEILISRLRNICPEAWWVGVGDSFRFIGGEAPRAPIWMQKNGLEWAHRLGQEPTKLFRRYVVHGLPFAAMLLGKSALRGLSLRFAHKKSPVQSRNENEHVSKSQTGSNALSAIHVGELNYQMSGRSSTLANLQAMVLLGGVMRPSRLSQSIGRSMMDLPVDENTTLLGHWMAHAAELQNACGLNALPVRLMIDRLSPDIASAAPFHLRLRVERDFGEYRGTGGVLRDIAADYTDDDLILVANAGQIIPGKLHEIVADLAEKGGDVTLVSHADGTPSGLMLVRREVLSLIPRSGFVDMKEQALERIAQEYDVRVLKLGIPSAFPVRSREEYLRALKVLHRPDGEVPGYDSGEDWRSSFNVLQIGATCDATARLFDSVVLAGGRVEPGAVVVRSIVCDGGVVHKDQVVVDDFVIPSREEKS